MLKPLSAEWRRMVRRLARIAGGEAAAEDALQDAFVRVHLHGRTHAVAKPQALMMRAAVNSALDERRRSQRAAFVELSEVEAGLEDDRPLQDEVCAARERLMLVRRAVAALPPRTREAFLLHRLEGRTYRQIADHLGISVSAVEKHIARAAFRLAEAVRELDAAK